MLLMFFVFSCKNQLKIVINVVFVKLKRNFSQGINALLQNPLTFLYGQLQSLRQHQSVSKAIILNAYSSLFIGFTTSVVKLT